MSIRSLLRKGTNLAKSASRIPGLKTLARGVPLLGTAIAVAEGVNLARGFMGGGGGGGGGGLPALPSFATGNMAPVPGAPGSDPNMGKRSIFRDDPNVAAYLKQFAIDDRFLKSYHRAPKGYVVLKDVNGDAYGLPKNLAKQYAGWKPAKKPPISVRDWSAMQRAKTVMKKLRVIEKEGRRLASFGGGNRRSIGTTNYIVEKGPGDVIQFPKRRKAA